MNLLILFFLCLGVIALYLLFRFILFRLGHKDSNYPIVQRAERKEKAKDTSIPFLPGSRMGYSDIEQALAESMEVQKLEKKKKKTHWFSKEELKHAIVLEELLHPKFKHTHGHHESEKHHNNPENEDKH